MHDTKKRGWDDHRKPVNTQDWSGDYTRMVNDFLRYGAEVCGNAQNAYFMTLIMMHEFGKPGEPVRVSQATLARYMGLKDTKQIYKISRSLSQKGILETRTFWIDGKRRNTYKIHHDELGKLLTQAKCRRSQSGGAQVLPVPQTQLEHHRDASGPGEVMVEEAVSTPSLPLDMALSSEEAGILAAQLPDLNVIWMGLKDQGFGLRVKMPEEESTASYAAPYAEIIAHNTNTRRRVCFTARPRRFKFSPRDKVDVEFFTHGSEPAQFHRGYDGPEALTGALRWLSGHNECFEELD